MPERKTSLFYNKSLPCANDVCFVTFVEPQDCSRVWMTGWTVDASILKYFLRPMPERLRL